jgi:chromosomal replication initiation ATPase DnaA
VGQGVDEDLARFYSGKAISPILGGEGFKQAMLEQHGTDDPEVAERKRVHDPASLEEIIVAVAAALGCDRQQIYESVRGRQNIARMLVAYFAYRAGQLTYRAIADALGMNHYSAVASSLRRLELLCRESAEIRELEQALWQKMP